MNDANSTYNNNIHSTIKMTHADASNNSDKVKYIVTSSKPSYTQPKIKVVDYVRNAYKRNIFSKEYTSN